MTVLLRHSLWTWSSLDLPIPSWDWVQRISTNSSQNWQYFCHLYYWNSGDKAGDELLWNWARPSMNTLKPTPNPTKHTHTISLSAEGSKGFKFQLHANNISIYLSELASTMHVTIYFSQTILKFSISSKLFTREHGKPCNPQDKGYFLSWNTWIHRSVKYDQVRSVSSLSMTCH